MNEWEERQQWLKDQREQLGELFELENFRLKAYPYEGQKGLALKELRMRRADAFNALRDYHLHLADLAGPYYEGNDD